MGHENHSRETEAEESSDRSFGIVFAVVFLVVGLWPILSGAGVRPWSLVVAGAILAVALLAPGWLAGPNRLWTRFGLALGLIVSPVALAVLYYGVITPYALVLRLFRKDPLRLAFDREARSYWIERDPPGPARGSMKNPY